LDEEKLQIFYNEISKEDQNEVSIQEEPNTGKFKQNSLENDCKYSWN